MDKTGQVSNIGQGVDDFAENLRDRNKFGVGGLIGVANSLDYTATLGDDAMSSSGFGFGIGLEGNNVAYQINRSGLGEYQATGFDSRFHAA